MRRFLAILAVIGLVLLAAPPANAAPGDNCRAVPLQLEGLPLDINIPTPQVCLTIDGNQAVTTITDLAGNVLMTIREPIQTIVERVEVPVFVPGPPLPAPAPETVTVTQPRATVTQAPATATETITVTEEGATITETAPPTTVTATPTNGPVGQDQDESDRLDNDDSEPTLAVPPPRDIGEVGPFFDFIPDDPGVAATTFSILGLIAGIAVGMGLLYLIYRSGRKKGEEEFAESFMAPEGPKHRA